jgi:hypothetical protein
VRAWHGTRTCATPHLTVLSQNGFFEPEAFGWKKVWLTLMPFSQLIRLNGCEAYRPNFSMGGAMHGRFTSPRLGEHVCGENCHKNFQPSLPAVDSAEAMSHSHSLAQGLIVVSFRKVLARGSKRSERSAVRPRSIPGPISEP